MITRISTTEDESTMFSDGLGGRYLGSPEVVGGLVAGYCESVRCMLEQRAAGTREASEFVTRVNKMVGEMSTIFSGQDPAYKPIVGWNSMPLGVHLRVALGQYWQEQRADHGDDPIRVLFAWLCWATFDAVSRSHGDPDLEGLILSDHTESAIRLLLGSDRR